MKIEPQTTDKELEALRQKMDDLNRSLCMLFVQRQRLSEQIAQSKAKSGRPILDEKREEAIVEQMRALAPEAAEEVEAFFRQLFVWSRRRQAQQGEK